MNGYQNQLSRRHQITRFLWIIVWRIGASWLPRSMGRRWKRILLQIFGAKIAPTAVIYSSARIYYPANLVMRDMACLADRVDCYNVDLIEIGERATVSQGAMLCTASHNIYSVGHELVTAPIHVASKSWVAAGAFIGMGVTVGEGAVVGAHSAVFKDVDPWTVVGGNPAKFIKKRFINNA